MMLFGEDVLGRAVTTEADVYVEPELSFSDAVDVARNYGAETAVRYQVARDVADKIRNFIGGLVAVHDYSANEAEYLRNVAWAGAERSNALSDLPF
jgi:hypothetical protein